MRRSPSTGIPRNDGICPWCQCDDGDHDDESGACLLCGRECPGIDEPISDDDEMIE